MEDTLQLDLPLLLPAILDERDQCVERLLERLAGIRGIERADDLSKLPFAVGLSRQSRRTIRQNVVISLGIIALLVPAALFGLARIGLAILFHEGSTLLVVANGLRLLRYRE